MSTLEGGVSPQISFTLKTQVGTNPLGGIPEVLNMLAQFGDGTGADQVHLIHAKTYNFLASTPQIPDLQSLLDLSGSSISFTAVRFLAWRIQSMNAAFTIAAGNAGANEWNGRMSTGAIETWYPSSALNHGFTIVTAPSASGIPVTGSSRLWKLDPGANAVGPVDIVIAGS